MSSTVIAKNIQIGADGTASNNFTIFQPASPDGTLRIGNGNTGITSSLVTLTSAGVFSVTGTTTTTLAVAGNNISAVNSLGFRNRIINGDMRIDQRNAGASQTPTADDTFNVDRWAAGINVASKFSMQQNTADAPTTQGFSHCVKITSLSAYSLGAGDVAVFKQTVEGLNMADFAWGTASAKAVTLSFWVRSSLTGTFGGTMMNSAQNRAYPFTYTISAANTWEQKTINVAGDTTGTWLTTNGAGIKLGFQLGVGSTFTGTAGSWSANNYWGATGATNILGTNGATWYVTGVQLEAGTVASPFERRDYGRELMMCQRYYQTNSYRIVTSGNYYDVSFTNMRAAPTVAELSRDGAVGGSLKINSYSNNTYNLTINTFASTSGVIFASLSSEL